jgi:hypothetical protein
MILNLLLFDVRPDPVRPEMGAAGLILIAAVVLLLVVAVIVGFVLLLRRRSRMEFANTRRDPGYSWISLVNRTSGKPPSRRDQPNKPNHP